MIVDIGSVVLMWVGCIFGVMLISSVLWFMVDDMSDVLLMLSVNGGVLCVMKVSVVGC